MTCLSFNTFILTNCFNLIHQSLRSLYAIKYFTCTYFSLKIPSYTENGFTLDGEMAVQAAHAYKIYLNFVKGSFK